MGVAPKILALDAATNTGVAIGSAGDVPIFQTLRFAGSDPDAEHEQSFAAALRWIAQLLQVNRPDFIYIEAPLSPGISGATNANTTLRLIGLWATLSAASIVKGVPYRKAKVGQVRKGFLGHGNLPGAEAKRRVQVVCELLGWDPRNNNEADAGALFHHACRIHAPERVPPITAEMHARAATAAPVSRKGAAEALFRKRA